MRRRGQLKWIHFHIFIYALLLGKERGKKRKRKGRERKGGEGREEKRIL